MQAYTFLLIAVLQSAAVPPPNPQQTNQTSSAIVVTISPAPGTPILTPIADPATPGQIREYLQLSGDLESFRARWVAALDQNRSLGAPYWPESFWTAAKTAMQNADLAPMFVTLFQHGISRELMQEVLDAYHSLGAANFTGSMACMKLGTAESALAGDMEHLKLAKTLEVLNKVYADYKPQIKAARERYLAEHPDYVDK
jgi:hypothetical protein